MEEGASTSYSNVVGSSGCSGGQLKSCLVCRAGPQVRKGLMGSGRERVRHAIGACNTQ